MTLSQNELEQLAKLARIHLSLSEQLKAREQLGTVFDLFQQLSDIPTDHVEPLEHIIDEICPMREDLVTEHDQRDLWLSIAPKFDQGMFLVPKVIES